MKQFGAFLLALVFGLSITVALGGYRVNRTASMDGLLWQITDHRPARGDIVALCLPADFISQHQLQLHLSTTVFNPDCGHHQPLLKRLLGVGGDHVEMDRHRILVNGKGVSDSARIMVPQRNIDRQSPLEDHEVLVVGETPNSLDSRYFGPIDQKWILGTARRIY